MRAKSIPAAVTLNPTFADVVETKKIAIPGPLIDATRPVTARSAFAACSPFGSMMSGNKAPFAPDVPASIMPIMKTVIVSLETSGVGPTKSWSATRNLRKRLILINRIREMRSASSPPTGAKIK
jgi:hypothetical protein